MEHIYSYSNYTASDTRRAVENFKCTFPARKTCKSFGSDRVCIKINQIAISDAQNLINPCKGWIAR